jgi:hypothetical protein
MAKTIPSAMAGLVVPSFDLAKRMGYSIEDYVEKRYFEKHRTARVLSDVIHFGVIKKEEE